MAATPFADALSAELAARGVTQSALADAVGMKQNTVSRWVGGDFAPPPETVFAIEEALDVEPGALSQFLGFLPMGEGETPITITAAVGAAPELEDWQREALLAVYRTFVRKRAMSGSKRAG